MKKRDDSRYTNEELIVVCENWQKIASNNQVKLKTIKSVVSTKTILAKAIDCKVKDEVYWNLFSFELKIPYKSGVILIKASETKYPHLSFSFSNKTSFEFFVWKEDFIDKISKLFGKHEMQTGYSEFDAKYFIRTSNEAKMKGLLDKKTTIFLDDSEIFLFKLENSTLEIRGLINEFDCSKITEFIDHSKYIIDKIDSSNMAGNF